MPKANDAVVVPVWSLPPVNDDHRADGGESCEANDVSDEAFVRSSFHFDTSPPSENDTLSLSSPSSRMLTLCLANEHMPHPFEQLQPCIDAGATAVLLLRLPLLVVDAVSMSKGKEGGVKELEEGESSAFSANGQDLIQADGTCMAAAVAAHKNGAYMSVTLAIKSRARHDNTFQIHSPCFLVNFHSICLSLPI